MSVKTDGMRQGDVKLKLRKEQLELIKKRVKTGEVSIHKEIITEEKTIVMPVTREELVIENKVPNSETKTFRIPIREDRIEVINHPTTLADINIYHQEIQKTEHVIENLKNEKVNVEIVGEVNIVDVSS